MNAISQHETNAMMSKVLIFVKLVKYKYIESRLIFVPPKLKFKFNVMEYQAKTVKKRLEVTFPLLGVSFQSISIITTDLKVFS